MAGRIPMLDNELQKQICSFITKGNSYRDSCSMCDISESIFMKWRAWGREYRDSEEKDRNPNHEIYFQFLQATQKARVTYKALHIQNINKASIKNWTASAWMLERQYPDEFARREKVDQTNTNLNMEFSGSELTLEEIEEFKCLANDMIGKKKVKEIQELENDK